MFKLISILTITIISFSNCSPISETNNLEWWQHAVFYQVYPRSFKDSNGDGLGDLNGITEKMEHIQNIGATAFWLSPVFVSPEEDAGYDISDFYNIDPQYGSNEDFDLLLEKANQLGLRVVLDFVPNHSSDKHEWFQKSIKRIDPYTDFYVWHDGKIVNGTRQPPNNWISYFLGSAWEWNEERQQYYFHQFGKFQPDFNYRNPLLVEEMKNVLRFWLKKGVHGFRVDAVVCLFEDEQLRDEPRTNNPNCLPDDPCYLDHIYTQNLEETYDMIYQMRDVLKDFSKKEHAESKVMMTEAGAPIKKMVRYYGNATHDGASFTFNFYLLNSLSETLNAAQLKDLLDTWLSYLPEGRTTNWVIGNHDNHRVATRVGKERAEAFNVFILTLPGVAVSYNGEEIAMEDGYVSFNDSQDPSAINAGPDRYLLYTRDPERTPFQWNSERNAGFSTAKKTWLPVSDKYLKNNVELQIEDEKSSYYVYRDLIELRKQNVMIKGDLEYVNINDNVFVIKRNLKTETIVSVINFGNKYETVSLPSSWNLNEKLLVLISSHSEKEKESVVITNDIYLGPNESLVLESS